MNEPLFSIRNGYVKPSNVLVREKITPEIQNAICSCFYDLCVSGSRYGYSLQSKIEERLWVYFLNEDKRRFCEGGCFFVFSPYLKNDKNPWYKKLDLLEATIKHLSEIKREQTLIKSFIEQLNSEFERLNFAYRIIEGKIVEITSEGEIAEIEKAIEDSSENIRKHLTNALALLARRPEGDYRNSIKESISAVEAYCREKTGERTLGKALKHLESTSIVIPDVLKKSFELLYGYTNSEDTGIRHALMDETGKYTPSEPEALFMLVSCSAFINYLRKKSL
ncbi:hypothetical protein T229_06120 [Tannerella sp. oral taxon BU063 isolate Cell 5]|uniref:HEPN AbiJ-N-terminal domain-containing protein n=2 Tax=Tannerella serpentiformis TaxID=712710 RepID=W2CCV7_9BACT|nr:hypothetical protein T229_06120 [Tannerella sp. oral taxon BU063 isolate Cell 5]